MKDVLIKIKQNFENILGLYEENEKLAEYVNEILENEDRETTEEEENMMNEINDIFDNITDMFMF